MRKIFFTIAIVMALAIALTITITKGREEELPVETYKEMKTSSEDLFLHGKQSTPVRRSRFLAEEKNPRGASHCKKDNEICHTEGIPGSTCCNNKCVDLMSDHQNCGACKKKCKYTEACCRGECVNLSFDKRHCGRCNNRCMAGGYCIYGMCDYA